MSKTEIRLTVDVENPAEVKAAIEMLQKFTSAPAEKKEVVKKEATKKAEQETPFTPPVIGAVLKEALIREGEKKVGLSSAVKIEDIRAMLAKKVDAHRAAIKAKLTEFGAGNVTSLKEENYQAMMDFLTAL